MFAEVFENGVLASFRVSASLIFIYDQKELHLLLVCDKALM